MNIYRNKNLLKDGENKQHEVKTLLNKLRNYNPTKPKKIKAKEEILIAAENLINNREEVIDTFKTDIFPYEHGLQIKKNQKKNQRKSQKKNLKKNQ